MANFGESRFLGLTPRAVGLSVVAIAIVIGLFFIPEGVKFVFDGKAKGGRESSFASLFNRQSTGKKTSESSPRAALSRDALSSINDDMSKKRSAPEEAVETQRGSKRSVDSDEGFSGRKGGILSGWDFSVKAHPDKVSRLSVPSNLSFDKVISKEGASFFKQGRGAIPKFLKQEGLLGSPAEEAIQPLREEIGVVVNASAKSESNKEVASRLRSAHVEALKGLRAAGADRGVMLRWLDLPIVRFIDTRGGVNAGRVVRENFSPGLALNDLMVRQRRQRSFGASGVAPTNFRAEFSINGSDVEKVVVYSNGKVLRSVKLGRNKPGEPRLVKINGDATGVLTVVAYDSYGARPFSKSYSFYPKVSVFRQERDGTFHIAFLPGSARNSLDRFFLVGASSRRQSSDSTISTF